MANKSTFWKIYISAVVLFLVLLVAGLFWLNNWLKEYEASQPEQIVKTIIDNYLSEENVYGLKDVCSLKISDYETAETVNKAFSEIVNGRTLTAVSSAKKAENCDISYVVKADDDKLLYLFLKRKDGVSSEKYTITGAEFGEKLYKTYRISTSSDAEITVNGVKLSDEIRKNTKLPNIDFYLSGADVINNQICTLDNFVSTLSDVEGICNGEQLEINKDVNTFNIVQKFNGKENLAKFATDGCKAYAAYMQDDGSLNDIKKYFDTNTEMYNNIRTSLVMFAWDHDSFHFNDVTTSEFHKYNNDLYSCRVSFTQVLVLKSQEYYDNFDKYVYLRKDGESYKIIDMQSIGDIDNE